MRIKICNRCHRELPDTSQYFPLDRGKTRMICKECDPKYGRFLKDGESAPLKWTDKEIYILKEYYPYLTNGELRFLFFENRSIRGIESYASKIGTGHKTKDTLTRARIVGAINNPSCQKGRVFTESHKKRMSEHWISFYNPSEDDKKGILKAKTAKEKVSKRMKGKWAGDKNPRHICPLNGELNGRWEGGLTPLVNELRSEIKDWKMESAEFCNYRCIVTGLRFDDIHHITPFSEILNECLQQLGLNQKQKVQDYTTTDYESLRFLIIKKHRQIECGCCLNKEVHKLFHNTYGYFNNDKIQFVDFLFKLQNGFFNEFLYQNNLPLDLDDKYLDYLLGTEVQNGNLCASY